MGILLSQKHWDLTSEGKERGDSGPSHISGVEVALVFTRGLLVTSIQPMWKIEESERGSLWTHSLLRSVRTHV